MVKEIDVELPNGLTGTFTIPPSVDDNESLSKGFAPATTKCALILHGQGGHRNYCYQKLLAHGLATKLGIYSLRIDFRGCGFSPEVAEPRTVGRTLDIDVEDIQTTAEYIIDPNQNGLGISFTLSSIIGHSRGSLAMFLWAHKQSKLLTNGNPVEDRTRAIIVPNLINCSSRFQSHTVLKRYDMLPEDFEGVDQSCLRFGKLSKTWIPRAEIISLSEPNLEIVSEITPESCALSIYGLEDHIVPVEDSAHFANALNRGRKTHELILISGADHNFYGTEPIETENDKEDFNPDNLPLTSKKLVNYNYKVVEHILEYLDPKKEFERFLYQSLNIGQVARWKRIDGISNFRDLGGWNIIKPPTGLNLDFLPNAELYVKPNVAFRCAITSHVTPKGLQEMENLGIKVMFDLRSTGECKNDGIPPNLEKYGIKRIHAPCFTKEDYSPQAIAMRYSNLMTLWHTYVNVYDKLLSEATPTFKMIFEYIRDEVPKGNGFLFHCTAGKDRTGVLGMLILLFLGVDNHTVAKEYELTTYGLLPDHENIKSKFVAAIQKVKEKLAAAGQTLNYEDSIRQGRPNWTIEEDGFNNLISSRYEAMLSTIVLVNTKYGGIVGYMKDYLKFTDEDLTTIYKNLVVVGNFGGFQNSGFAEWENRPSKSKI